MARSPLVDEAALIDALQSGHLAGAYLDVFNEEPLPPESPFWAMEHVIVSPHNSAASQGNEGRAFAMFTANLARWLRGQALEQEVGER